MRVILSFFKVGVLTALMALVIMPTAAQSECPGAPPTRLEGETEGRVAQVYSSLRADIGSPVILRTMRGGETFQITGDPVCAGPHYWIPITYQGVSGWATEGYLNQYWLEPIPDSDDGASAQGTGDGATGGPTLPQEPPFGVTYSPATGACPGAPQPRLTDGDTAQVAQLYSSLRANIHSNRILRVIGPGVNIDILNGPYCATLNGIATPYNWYYVEVGSQRGWVTEGTGNGYWLRPVE